MVSPVVIGGLAVLDGAILGQLAYAVAQYRKNHEHGSADGHPDPYRRAGGGRPSR